MFKKILIANRGEIAVRIIKACNELDIIAAVIYSDADSSSLHVQQADESYSIGGRHASDSYLNQDKIIQIAMQIGADAIHPGYGFLSENHIFIQKVENAGIVFIGPSSESVKLMGNKTAARELMIQNGVPVVPGSKSPITSIDDAIKYADEIDYPIMLKAAGGGGGKGMRIVSSRSEIESAYSIAKSESRKAFGNDEIYIEKFVNDPKHIEVQIIADKLGNFRHLYERECSIQRRHQKIIEEAPSPTITDKERIKVTDIALKAARACKYVNAGTIEMLMDKERNFFFLEMNTRLQVEHAVTESVTNIDIVKEQINIAHGNQISFEQDSVKLLGNSIECRIYAEDPLNNFAPSTGRITNYVTPKGMRVRIDSGIKLDSEVSIYYDPILSKIITFGKDREEALKRMVISIKKYLITGVKTNIAFCKWILEHQDYIKNDFNINFIDKELSNYMNKKSNPQNLSDDMVASIITCALLFRDSRNQKTQINLVTPNNNWITDDE